MARFGRLGWFLGLIFGTLFGVLFAPRAGKELRSKMKSDRKRKGGLGLAPLQDDMRSLGGEIAGLARELYESAAIQDIVQIGRKKMKEIEKDLVGEVADFEVNRIRPFRKGFKHLASKAKRAGRIGKKAAQAIKKEMRGK